MTIDLIKNALPDYAKDIKLNLSTVLSPEGSDLNEKQLIGIALAASYAARNRDLIGALQEQAQLHLSNEEINGIKAAATIMAMNNIYYRFTHSMTDNTYSTLPAKLRMNVMMNPGVDKVIFELCSLAVSAINGCSKCMNSHAAQLEKIEVSKLAIQTSIRIASVIYATAIASEIGY